MSIDGHNVKIIQTIRGHTSDVTCCDFAPNFTLITGSSDKTVRIWDWTGGRGYTERSCSPLRAHKYQVTCVRASPQGSMLASASVDGTAVVWSVATCARLYTMTQVNGDAVRVCRTIFDHEGTTQALAFTPDSQYLVTACSLEVVRVWLVRDLVDTAADALCCPLARVDNVQDMGVLSVDVSRRITFDVVVEPFDVYDGHASTVTSVRFSHSGAYLISTSLDKLVKVWDEQGNCVASLQGHDRYVNCAAISRLKSSLSFNDSGAYSISTSLDKLVKVWDEQGNCFASLQGHVNRAAMSKLSLFFNYSGTYLISTSLDKLVKVWDEQGNCVASLQGHDRYVNCAAISRDATLLVSGSTGSNDKQVIVWDLKGNLTLDSELNHFRTISAFADGVSENQMAENVDPNGNKVTLLEKLDDVAEGTINSCSFYGNSLLATGSGYLNLKRKILIDPTSEPSSSLKLDPSRKVQLSKSQAVSTSTGSTLRTNPFAKLRKRQSGVSKPPQGESVRRPSSALSKRPCAHRRHRRPTEDRDVMYVREDRDMYVREGREVYSRQDRDMYVREDRDMYVREDRDMYFREDTDSYLRENRDTYVREDRDTIDKLVRLFKVLEGNDNIEEVNYSPLEGHTYAINHVEFSKSGDMLATCSLDGCTIIWNPTVSEWNNDINYNLEQGCLFVQEDAHDYGVQYCDISPNLEPILNAVSDAQSYLLATCGNDSLVKLWRITVPKVFQTAIAGKIHFRAKQLIDWSTSDLIKWLKDVNMDDLSASIQNTSLDGKKILTMTEEQICSGLDLDEETTEKLTKELRWLKKGTHMAEPFEDRLTDIPHEFLCPITHEVMREPVTCSDGYTYEKNAITEWFMSGKRTSPMTNESLVTTDFVGNADLRHAIRDFLEM
ncbi:unnamed protein product [Phaedon cochleariae]|uniref:U-box domain-containing protein n=1 Tax=Phaedon cochleariae TaxID=80249 RepID=A0A9P0GNA8_PHACE|nr:unnamed protein product [Phaedon cochleariae]